MTATPHEPDESDGPGAGRPGDDPVHDGVEEERPWWDDPSLPWAGEPSRQDLACWGGIAAVGIYALVMLPLRPVLLGYTPYVLAGVTGSRTAVVMVGALAATGDPWWWWGWLLATVSIVKFDWVYFWAGRLWGRGLVEVMTGDSERARRRNERAERLALRWAVPAVVLTYLPVPLPGPIIYATVAMAGMSWRRFLVVDLVAAAVVQGIYLYLGYRIGEPAVRLVEQYAQWMIWLSLAILVAMVVGAVWNSRRKAARNGAEA